MKLIKYVIMIMLNKTKCMERSVFIFRRFIFRYTIAFEFYKMQILLSDCVR